MFIKILYYIKYNIYVYIYIYIYIYEILQNHLIEYDDPIIQYNNYSYTLHIYLPTHKVVFRHQWLAHLVYPICMIRYYNSVYIKYSPYIQYIPNTQSYGVLRPYST